MQHAGSRQVITTPLNERSRNNSASVALKGSTRSREMVRRFHHVVATLASPTEGRCGRVEELNVSAAALRDSFSRDIAPACVAAFKPKSRTAPYQSTLFPL